MRPQIGQFLQYLRVERGASPHTLKGYREDLHALAEYLSDGEGQSPAPGGITTIELRGFLSALTEAGYAKTSISRRMASVRSFLKFGQREGWAKSNPAKALRNPRKSRKLPHFLTSDEVGKLLDAPKGVTSAAVRDRAILETAYSAGLRVSELVGLNDGDLDFPAGILRIRGKGKKERLSPIGSYASRALKQWQAKRTLSPREKTGREAPVFTNKFGTRLTTRSVARMLEKYIQETGLDGRTSPHTLRHSFATH
ncbi:MAG TPA: tyrosine-type recombinase/integrase, partial [Lacipirellulaceae bacterium]|nr:tyrosine-type recombinase/integrase [Lacipirellulaceae bacterium]